MCRLSDERCSGDRVATPLSSSFPFLIRKAAGRISQGQVSGPALERVNKIITRPFVRGGTQPAPGPTTRWAWLSSFVGGTRSRVNSGGPSEGGRKTATEASFIDTHPGPLWSSKCGPASPPGAKRAAWRRGRNKPNPGRAAAVRPVPDDVIKGHGRPWPHVRDNKDLL